MDEATKEWLTIKEAARRCKHSYGKVYDAVKAGELKAYQREEGAAWRVRVEDLDAWVMGGGDA